MPESSATVQRDELAEQLLNVSYDKLNDVQRSVIDLIATEAPSGVSPELRKDERTFGERLADHVAAIGGSWGFIIGFGVFLALWMGWNELAGKHLAFDVYPFIFLNLMLSMLAAIQAPVIMMSQNRAATKDREAAEHDYIVNLRSELELLHLHDKLDAVREHQLEALIKGQGETIELLKQQIAALVKQHEGGKEP
jgi:uncharacterized membrane protein